MKIFLAIWLIGVTGVFSIPSLALAQSSAPNPLEIDQKNQKDPAVPDGFGRRSLSQFEKYRLQKVIAKLDLFAQTELDQGNKNKAFKLWYRQLRLARLIEPPTEIKALGKVGAIAWQENRGADVRNVAERLTKIESELESHKPESSPAVNPLTPTILPNLAQAYQQIRYLDRAIAIYQQILANGRKADDLAAEQKNLEILGKLHLARFDYSQAATVYQELLSLAEQESTSQSVNQTNPYLYTLADIYDRTEQTQKAIAIRKRLVERYTTLEKSYPIPKLQLAIAQDYQTSNQIAPAIAAYNQAFELAAKTKQLALASDTLTKLAKLYQAKSNTPQAIGTYRRLLKLQQQSYDYYGSINTYAALGKIHLQQNQKSQAKDYFQQGLKLAKSLDFKVKYFTSQIKAIN